MSNGNKTYTLQEKTLVLRIFLNNPRETWATMAHMFNMERERTRPKRGPHGIRKQIAKLYDVEEEGSQEHNHVRSPLAPRWRSADACKVTDQIPQEEPLADTDFSGLIDEALVGNEV